MQIAAAQTRAVIQMHRVQTGGQGIRGCSGKSRDRVHAEYPLSVGPWESCLASLALFKFNYVIITTSNYYYNG